MILSRCYYKSSKKVVKLKKLRIPNLHTRQTRNVLIQHSSVFNPKNTLKLKLRNDSKIYALGERGRQDSVMGGRKNQSSSTITKKREDGSRKIYHTQRCVYCLPLLDLFFKGREILLQKLGERVRAKYHPFSFLQYCRWTDLSSCPRHSSVSLSPPKSEFQLSLLLKVLKNI